MTTIGIDFKDGSIEFTPPGIYTGMSIEDYHDDDAISNSGLSQVNKSINHYKRQKATPFQPSDAMKFGTAVHYAFLEPEEFQRLYVDPVPPVHGLHANYLKTATLLAQGKSAAEIAGIVNSKQSTIEGHLKKPGVKEMADHYTQYPPDDFPDLGNSTLDEVRYAADELASHPTVAALFSEGQAETSIFWEDDETGVRCRCRPDWLRDDPTDPSKIIALDLKTARSAKDDDFRKSIANFRYHVQAAWYSHGVEKMMERPVEAFIFVVVESSEPYNIGVYHLDEDGMSRGMAQAREDLQKFADWKNGVNDWTGYPQQIQTISLPAWA